MEKRNVIAHIFAASVFFIFSIILFKMGNGSIVVAQYFQHNGDPEAKKGLATLIVMYGLILSAVSGLNFALSDDDQRFVSWIIATIIIAVAFFVFSLFSLHVVIVYIIGGIVIALSLAYLVYTLIIYLKLRHKEKKEREENEVIDV